MDAILTETVEQIGAATPVIAGLFGAFIVLSFLSALGYFALRRSRGAVK